MNSGIKLSVKIANASPKHAANPYGNGSESSSGAASAAPAAPNSVPAMLNPPMNRPRSQDGTVFATTSIQGVVASPPHSDCAKQAKYTTSTIGEPTAGAASAHSVSTSTGSRSIEPNHCTHGHFRSLRSTYPAINNCGIQPIWNAAVTAPTAIGWSLKWLTNSGTNVSGPTSPNATMNSEISVPSSTMPRRCSGVIVRSLAATPAESPRSVTVTLPPPSEQLAPRHPFLPPFLLPSPRTGEGLGVGASSDTPPATLGVRGFVISSPVSRPTPRAAATSEVDESGATDVNAAAPQET